MWLSLFVLVYVPGRVLMLAAGAQRESGSPSFSVSLVACMSLSPTMAEWSKVISVGEKGSGDCLLWCKKWGLHGEQAGFLLWAWILTLHVLSGHI